MESPRVHASYNCKGKRESVESRLRQIPLDLDEFGYIRIRHIGETQGQVTDNAFIIYERRGGWVEDVALPGMLRVAEELKLKELTDRNP